MKKIALVLLLLLLAPFAWGEDTETSRFLGPESDWGFARLELKDIHGGLGGKDVAVSGSGSACVRLVDSKMEEKRFVFTLEKGDALAIFKLALEQDLLGVKPKPRAGAPGELRSEIVLENALGQKRSVIVWQKDSFPAFDKVGSSLRALEKKCEGKEPAYSGKLAPFFEPLPGVHVTVLIYLGKPDPSFDLVRPEDWEKLRSFLPGLTKLEQPQEKRPKAGYRGIGLLPRDVPGLPRALNVFKGTIRLDDNPAEPTLEKDEKGLEAWLMEEAKKRGIDAAAPR
jgi:hypothetical protein